MPSPTTNAANPPTTRLAPSPTGAMHLGNARTFLINWAIARQEGQRIVLRIEDLDTPRIKPGADTQAIEDLRWLGMDWDEGPHYQAHDLSPYSDALESLRGRGLIYPCTCTRGDIRAALSAPHKSDGNPRYPGTCRPVDPVGGAVAADAHAPGVAAWRVRVPDEPITFDDRVLGEQSHNVQREVGDFIVASKAGLPAYQLAVVIDDARQSVTDIVRGDDLASSAARQLWLYRLLDLTPLPRYTHVPMVIGPDGRRLAKRHGDTRLSAYREGGVRPERVVGLIAWWCGMTKDREPMTPVEFRERFALPQLPAEHVVFRPEDHDWLLAR